MREAFKNNSSALQPWECGGRDVHANAAGSVRIFVSQGF